MWLTVVSEGGSGNTVEVTGNRFVIGRDGSCDLSIDDPKISREHAAITPGLGGARILHDLGSANGTFVNGAPVKAPIGFTAPQDRASELRGGEWILLGDTRILATLVDPRKASPAQQSS